MLNSDVVPCNHNLLATTLRTLPAIDVCESFMLPFVLTVGALIGLALRHNGRLDLRLPPHAYKRLLGEKPALDDFEVIIDCTDDPLTPHCLMSPHLVSEVADKALHDGLKWMIEHKGAEQLSTYFRSLITAILIAVLTILCFVHSMLQTHTI